MLRDFHRVPFILDELLLFVSMFIIERESPRDWEHAET